MEAVPSHPTNQPVKAVDGKCYRCTPCKMNYTGVSGLTAHFRKHPDHRTEDQQYNHEMYLRRTKKAKAKAYREARRANGDIDVRKASTSPRMKFCTGCGRPRKDDFKFCAFCGEKLVAA